MNQTHKKINEYTLNIKTQYLFCEERTNTDNQHYIEVSWTHNSSKTDIILSKVF